MRCRSWAGTGHSWAGCPGTVGAAWPAGSLQHGTGTDRYTGGSRSYFSLLFQYATYKLPLSISVQRTLVSSGDLTLILCYENKLL